MMIVSQPIMATIATAAVGAATVILSAASISNIYETYSLVQQQQRLQLLSSHDPSAESESSSSSSSTPPPPPEAVTKASSWKTIDDAVDGLTNMSKRELVELFLHCEPPAVSTDLAFFSAGGELEEEEEESWRYDGYLLTNGPILTPVTNFITNKLFGRGRPWLGKAYLNPTSSASNISNNRAGVGIGKNRFSGSINNHRQTTNNPTTSASNTNTLPDDEFLDRTFEYSIGTSIFPSPLSSTSLFNRYASHCTTALSIMSLIWRGMVDELRVITLCEENNDNENGKTNKNNKKNVAILLLGMGYFTWSGGAWNSAPFCLVARRCGSKARKNE